MSLQEVYAPAALKVGILAFTHQYTRQLSSESPNGSVFPNLLTLPPSLKIALLADLLKVIICFVNICPANFTTSFSLKIPHNIHQHFLIKSKFYYFN